MTYIHENKSFPLSLSLSLSPRDILTDPRRDRHTALAFVENLDMSSRSTASEFFNALGWVHISAVYQVVHHQWFDPGQARPPSRVT